MYSQEKSINIGAILSFSGMDGQSGIPNQNALKLCVDDWNERSGVAGKAVHLKVYDCESNPEKSALLAQQMLKEYEPNIVYLAMTSVTLSAHPLFEKNKVIQLIAAGGDVFSNKPEYVLRGYFSVYDLASYFTENLERNFGKKKFTVIYEKNGFTDMIIDGLNKASQKYHVDMKIIQISGDELNFEQAIREANIEYAHHFRESKHKGTNKKV